MKTNNNDEHKPLYTLNDNGFYIPIIWVESQTQTYLDEVQNKMKQLDELSEQICVITQKYANYQKCRKPKMFDEKQTKHIKKRRKEGASLRQIAKEMNCSEGTIRNYLKR